MQITDKFGSDLKLTNELTSGRVICQTFTAIHEHLSSVSVNFATYKRQNTCKVCFEICDNGTGDSLFKQIYSAGMLRDNDYFSFPVGLSTVKDKKYDLVVYSDGVLGNTITAKYGVKKHYKENFTIGADIISNGEFCCVFEYGVRDEDVNREIITEDSIVKKNYTKGLISIVIPVYNSVKYLSALFASIKKQTYNCYEIIVVDDGSDDAKEVNQFVDSQELLVVKFIRLSKNKGACFARNRGETEANGEYLFFCDSDIVLEKNIFQMMIQSLHDNKDCSWSYCNFSVGDEKRHFMDFNHQELRKRNLCCTMSLLKHECFPKFRNDLKRLQDWDLFLTMAESGHKGVWLNDYLFSTIERDGITKGSVSWAEAIEDLKKYHSNLGA